MHILSRKNIAFITLSLVMIFSISMTVVPSNVSAAGKDNIPAGCPGSNQKLPKGKEKPKNCPGIGGGQGIAPNSRQCGSGDDAYVPSFDIGCIGRGNPIADAIFAIIRVLSAGVGIVVVGSIIVGGIQYSASRGDPQATALAIGRIRSSLIGLVIFIFAYAILNYIIPVGFLGQ